MNGASDNGIWCLLCSAGHAKANRPSAGVQFLFTEQLSDGGTLEKKFQCRQIAKLQHSVSMAVFSVLFCMNRTGIISAL